MRLNHGLSKSPKRHENGTASSKNKKPYPDGIWPCNEYIENITIAIPYAGITQVRFKGYLLSLKFGTPCFL
jgi:hypothetical protein